MYHLSCVVISHYLLSLPFSSYTVCIGRSPRISSVIELYPVSLVPLHPLHLSYIYSALFDADHIASYIKTFQETSLYPRLSAWYECLRETRHRRLYSGLLYVRNATSLADGMPQYPWTCMN